MHHVLVIGAGKIGSLIAYLLASHPKDYDVHLADIHQTNPHAKRLQGLSHLKYARLDASDAHALAQFTEQHGIQVIISSLPFYCNPMIAGLAAVQHLHYFDLTEDVQTTRAVKEAAHHSHCTFVPQCGLAPGFVSIVANHLMLHFPMLDTVKLRVGALPLNISNALQYSLTWSTEGLINEYSNLCHAIEYGQEVMLQPLEGLEEVNIDGLTYEAFNTSGGIGSLVDTYRGKIAHLSYKTLRYPGHCAKVKFLMNDLKLQEDRETLKRIFENTLPKTYQDVVLVYVSVMGMQEGQLTEESYVKKFYSQKLGDAYWTAIQLTTASSLCAVVDLALHHTERYHGFVRQEQFSFDDFIHNRFGQYYM